MPFRPLEKVRGHQPGRRVPGVQVLIFPHKARITASGCIVSMVVLQFLSLTSKDNIADLRIHA